MADLILTKEGDLKVEQLNETLLDQGRILNAEYDLAREQNNLSLLIRRAIETPKGHIAEYSLLPRDIEVINENYGSLIYQELSEGITLNFISRVKSHINESLRVAGLLNSVRNVTVSVGESNFYQININITFTDQTPPTTITVNLQ